MNAPLPTAAMLLDHALRYSRFGWSVIPIQGKKPATLQPSGKLLQWEPFTRRQPTDEQLHDWFVEQNHPTGLAVICGAVSASETTRLVVRDFDTTAGYEAWANNSPDLARDLPTSKTGKGYHVICTTTAAEWRRLAGTSAYVKFPSADAPTAPPGELRGGACYCVLPPSLHADGATRYRWIVEPTEPPPIIDDLESAGIAPPKTKAKASQEPQVALQRESPYRSNREGDRGVLSVGGSSLLRDPLCKAAGGDKKSSRDDDLEAPISRTLPAGPGDRHGAIWNFARELKGMPQFASEPASKLRSVVARWHAEALPAIRTQPFGETWRDFCAAWPRVKFPAGIDPLPVAIERAKELPYPLAAQPFDDERAKLLIAICAQLQIAWGDQPFYLSTEVARKVVATSRPTANAWLKIAFDLGILTEEQKHTTTRARRMRYHGDYPSPEPSAKVT